MIGDRLGKWVIFKELGRGGMGRVYLAQEELTGRQAALKILATELAQEIGFLHRFQREIETLSRLDHANIESAQGFDLALEAVEEPDFQREIETLSRLDHANIVRF